MIIKPCSVMCVCASKIVLMFECKDLFNMTDPSLHIYIGSQKKHRTSIWLQIDLELKGILRYK